MDSLKEQLKIQLKNMLEQGVNISVNMHQIHNINTLDHYIIHDDATYMFDYMWDENGNFLQFNVNILERDKKRKK